MNCFYLYDLYLYRFFRLNFIVIFATTCLCSSEIERLKCAVGQLIYSTCHVNTIRHIRSTYVVRMTQRSERIRGVHMCKLTVISILKSIICLHWPVGSTKTVII